MGFLWWSVGKFPTFEGFAALTLFGSFTQNPFAFNAFAHPLWVPRFLHVIDRALEQFT